MLQSNNTDAHAGFVVAILVPGSSVANFIHVIPANLDGRHSPTVITVLAVLLI